MADASAISPYLFSATVSYQASTAPDGTAADSPAAQDDPPSMPEDSVQDDEPSMPEDSVDVNFDAAAANSDGSETHTAEADQASDKKKAPPRSPGADKIYCPWPTDANQPMPPGCPVPSGTPPLSSQ
jgi:hypothetical protein